MQSVSGISRVSGVRRFRSFNRLWVIALVAAGVATGIDLLIARVATPIVNAPADYPSFTWFTILVGCLIGAIGGYTVFITLLRLARRPVRAFLAIAAGVLVVSYGLPILPIVNPLPRFAGVNWGIAVTLMLMHTVTAVVIVSSLIAFRKAPTVNAPSLIEA